MNKKITNLMPIILGLLIFYNMDILIKIFGEETVICVLAFSGVSMLAWNMWNRESESDER